MKNRPHHWTAVVLMVVGATFCGCASDHSRSSADRDGYRTIPAEIGRDTDKAKALTAEATAAMKEEDLDRAEQLLRDALSADVMFGPAHNNLGQLYYQQKRYYEAAWEFQYAIRLMPNQPIPRNNLGLVFEATGQIDQAAEQYELAVAEEPDNPELLGNLARARIRNGESGEEVRDLLRQIVMKDTREQWRRWAENQLHLMPESKKDAR